MESAILVGTHSLDELRELATSAGARIIDEVVQRRERPDPATFIGKGKVEELREQVLLEGVDLVIFDDATVADKATFDQPHQYAVGFSSVIVNGGIVFDGEKMTGVMSGSPLYGNGYAGR